MSSGIAKALKSFVGSAFDRGARDDDAVDRLNHLAMHGLLIFLAIFTGTKQYAGSPIYCWLPANYIEKFQRKFANHYCWVHTMYNIPFDETIPNVEEKRYFNDVSYYRWSSMMFILLASLFRIPQLLWKELKKFSGANIEKLVDMTTETTLMEQSRRDEQLSHVAEFVHRWVTTRNIPEKKGIFAVLHRSISNFIFCYGKRSGHNLVVIYLFIKFLYLLNSIGQLFIISSFLKTNFLTFGTNAVASYAQNGQWEDEHVFPRVTLCDMKVRVLGNVNIYTIQCVLGINIFLEKFFFVVWFCLLFMIVANALSFLRWAIQLLHREKNVQFMTKYFGYLLPKGTAAHQDHKMFQEMSRRYLKADGVFLIRMIAENSTDLLTVDLIRQIWMRFRDFNEAEGKEHVDEFQKENTEESTMNGGAGIQLDDVDK